MTLGARSEFVVSIADGDVPGVTAGFGAASGLIRYRNQIEEAGIRLLSATELDAS